MDINKEINADAPLEPMEITSPRTAEQPGPTKTNEADCCGVNPKVAPVESAHDHEHGENSYIPTVISLILLLTGIGLDYSEVGWFIDYTRLLLYGAAYLLVGGKVVWHAVQNIAKGTSIFNEFLLMTIATVGAFYIGEYAEGVAVMLFYVIGEHFQEAAVARSRRSIKALIDNRPEVVGLLKNGQVTAVNPATVKIGDIIQLKAGEKVALDGDLLNNESAFNTAALTGESKPDMKQKGETILAGMVNLNQVSEIKITATFENSALSKILQLVEQASSQKAKTQQFITRFAQVYTPIVVFLAIGLTFIPYFFVADYSFNDWLYRALIFLVISCPCALVVSIPLGYFGGIGAASKNGILFKGSNFLDLLTKVDTIVVDKTGTLTEGIFQVQEIKPISLNPTEFVSLTAALESKSTHPVAQAVVNYAGETYKAKSVTAVEEFAGYGLKGTVDGQTILAGNSKLLQKFNVAYLPEIDNIVESLVAVAINSQYAGYIVVADKIKEDAVDAVESLRQLGISQVIMLSGDKDSIVQQVAKTLRLDQAYGNLLPEDKVAKVAALKEQGKTLAFIGDGINDAPVITLADVGMAMGGLGSDAAIETADVVIQTDQPSKIATAIKIGKQTNQIVWQNIALAFGVKILVLLLGAGGLASMWEAVFADVGVAFLAILNAVRIQKMKF